MIKLLPLKKLLEVISHGEVHKNTINYEFDGRELAKFLLGDAKDFHSCSAIIDFALGYVTLWQHREYGSPLLTGIHTTFEIDQTILDFLIDSFKPLARSILADQFFAEEKKKLNSKYERMAEEHLALLLEDK